MLEVIARLRATPGWRRIRTSFAPAIRGAQALYEGLGFHKTGQIDGGEVVVVLEVCQ